jgi:hypothetical protein
MTDDDSKEDLVVRARSALLEVRSGRSDRVHQRRPTLSPLRGSQRSNVARSDSPRDRQHEVSLSLSEG